MRDLPWPRRFTLGSEPADAERMRELLRDLGAEVWACVRALAASTLDVPQLEFKLVAGEALFTLVEVVTGIEDRIAELGGEPRRQLDHASADRLAAALRVPSAQRTRVLAAEWLQRLVGELRALPCDPLLDGPTERVRRRALRDIVEILEWFDEAGLTVPPDGATATAATRTQPVPAPKAQPVPAPKARPAISDGRPALPARPGTGARDDRFTTFEHTRDYRKAADWQSSGTAYEDDLVELLRINRDEIDAIETFALALYDLVDEAPLEVLRHLARLAWDEARHTAIGHALLAARGEDPFRFQCSMIGIKVRGAMDGWGAWTQITLFGELGIVGPMRRIERAAKERGDVLTAAAFGYICRDETMHLRSSRDLITRHHPAGSLAAAEAITRQRAGALLAQFGILSEEQYQALDNRQIFELLGE
jgi:hypothetical protein